MRSSWVCYWCLDDRGCLHILLMQNIQSLWKEARAGKFMWGISIKAELNSVPHFAKDHVLLDQKESY
jgi:hypothetical protein